MKFTLAFLLIFTVYQEDFKSAQKKYSRVREAYSQKEAPLKRDFTSKNCSLESSQVYLRVFKEEKVLELWAKTSTGTYALIKPYPICSASGDLGPKRKQGDYQVPEGYYHIDRFNPSSSFHLSLGINYPNKSDRILSNASDLGGDIFIHGNCVSIGCMAMTDEIINEIYIAAVEAKNSGQSTIPVHIYPFRMNEENYKKHQLAFKDQTQMLTLWSNIKEGYVLFEKTKKLPSVLINTKGLYTFQ